MCKSQWIDDLIKLVHPKDGHTKIAAMLRGYLDESGIQDGASLCLVGGYFGGPGQWRKVGIAWQKVLDKFFVPEFHAKQFWAFNPSGQRVGPYKGWDERKASQFLSKLISIINGHRIHPVSTMLVVDAFNRLTYNQRRFLTGGALRDGQFVTSGCPSKPYFVPFTSVILGIASHAPFGGKAHFFFDLNKNFKGYALDLYAIVKQSEVQVKDRLGEIGFPTGQEAVQHQTADMLCYLSYQFGQKNLHNPSRRPDLLLRSILQGMLLEEDFPFLNEAGLSEVLRGIQLPSDKST